MYTVFKNMDDFYKRAGEQAKTVEEANQCIEEFKAHFWKTYSDLMKLIRQNQLDISNTMLQITGKDFRYGVSEQLLLQTLIDAYDDLFRLTDYHPTETPTSLKTVSYITYWLIRRKPLLIPEKYEDIVTVDNETFKTRGRMHILFINEYFASNLLLNTIFKRKKILKQTTSDELEVANKQLEIFQGFLFYTLVYRVDTPKYIEATMLACTIHPVWEVDPDIWEIIEKELDK